MSENTNTTTAGKGKPGRKPGQAPKVRPALDMGSLEAVMVTERRTMAEFRRTRGEREPEQKAIDQLVSKAYDAWIEAGKPTNWVNQPGLLVKVPEAQFETLQFRIRKSGVFYDLKIRFGDIKIEGRGSAKMAECVFTATDRPANEQADDVSDEDDDDDAETGELSEDTGSNGDSAPAEGGIVNE